MIVIIIQLKKSKIIHLIKSKSKITIKRIDIANIVSKITFKIHIKGFNNYFNRIVMNK